MSSLTDGRLHVIYDGDCALCRRVLTILSRFDVRTRWTFYRSQDSKTIDERFPGVTPEELDEAMVAIADDGSRFFGFFAFRRMLWSTPWLWGLLPMFYFPGAAVVGSRIYAWVARNRHRFGCGTQTCAVPGRKL